MPVIEKDSEILTTLRGFEVFQDIDPAALQWMIDHSVYQCYREGDSLFEPGQAIDHMQIITKGRYLIRMERQGETQEMGVWEAGNITGVLPFSRMVSARARGIALEPTCTLELHRDHFTEMVNVSYELTQALVSVMTSRVREFTGRRFQTEKLFALGKLSAGLAHELNNPASAMVRNAEELYKKVHSTPEKFKAVITMRITPEQTDRINAILFAKIKAAKDYDPSMMEREAAVDDLLDWLEDEGIQDAEDVAETFADFNVTTDDLDQVREIAEGQSIGTLLWWIESTLSLECLVEEIHEASERISTLVRSIKDYSHMDRGVSIEQVDLHRGIKSTIVMLKHKLKKKNIQLHKELDPDLPNIQGYAGELNQVWTNLITNAIDAMEEGGTLGIKTYQERDQVFVEVSDTGTGIPEDEQTRIFEPFFTTKSMGEGTGMGLDIVQRIMDHHKAEIGVKSQPGNTTFTLRFSKTIK